MLDELEEPVSKANKDYWDIGCRRRWWFLLPCFAAWAIFFLVLCLLPAGYRSEATILISDQTVPDKIVPPNVDIQLPQRLQGMTQQILSRSKLQKIIEDFRLYPTHRTSVNPVQVVERMRKDIEILPVPIDDLAQEEDPVTAAKRALTVTPGTGKPPDTLVFRLSYTAGKPHLAQQVTDALISLFIEENLAQRQRQSETTTNFLQSQVEETRGRMNEQGERLQQFKARYLGQLPEQKESNMQILSSLQSRLQSANDALNRAEQQKLYLESLSQQYKSLEASLSQGDTSTLESPAAIDKELERLRTQLTTLRGQYTERHPDVQNTKDEIAQAEKLKKHIEDQINMAKSQPGQVDTTPHPSSWAEMQQLSPMIQVESQLKSNRREVETAQASINELEHEISGYQSRLDVTPMREQELQELTSAYDQIKGNYESLLARQNDSQVATNLEKRQGGEEFVVLNPPSLPTKPNAPDRFMLGLIGLGIGVALGLIVAVISELAQDQVHTHSELQGLVDAPILAEVPVLLSTTERRAEHRKFQMEWLSATVMVVAMTAGTLFLFVRG